MINKALCVAFIYLAMGVTGAFATEYRNLSYLVGSYDRHDKCDPEDRDHPNHPEYDDDHCKPRPCSDD